MGSTRRVVKSLRNRTQLPLCTAALFTEEILLKKS
jgi:hypothetical protein